MHRSRELIHSIFIIPDWERRKGQFCLRLLRPSGSLGAVRAPRDQPLAMAL
jgi:hypothetical protein